MGLLKRALFVASLPVTAPLWLAGFSIFTIVTIGGLVILYPTVGAAYYIKTGEHIPLENISLPAYIDKKVYEYRMKNMTYTHKCGAQYKMEDATFKLGKCNNCGEEFEDDISRPVKEEHGTEPKYKQV